MAPARAVQSKQTSQTSTVDILKRGDFFTSPSYQYGDREIAKNR